MSNIQCSVYSIDLESISEKESTEEKVRKIVRNINSEIRSKALKSGEGKGGYELQKNNGKYDSEYIKILLYYRKKSYTPIWCNFISGIADSKADILLAQNKSSSYICFFYTEDSIYAVCAGTGSSAISKYVKPMFGLDILMKLVDGSNKSIKSLKSRGITGNTLAMAQIFKKDQFLLDQETYGKLYKEICTDIDSATLGSKLGIEIGDKFDANCIAKSSIRICRSMNFEVLVTFISKLAELDKVEDDHIRSINRLEFIEKKNKNDSELIKVLDKVIKKNMYKYYKKTIDNFSFEIFHKEYEKYYYAHKYILFHNSSNGCEEIYEQRIELENIYSFIKTNYSESLKNQSKFIDLLEKLYIRTTDDNGNELTSELVFKHLNGEILYKEKTYFLIDNLYVRMETDLVDSLNKDILKMFEHKRSNNMVNSLNLPKWDLEKYNTEDHYNASYVGEGECLVFHKILYKNIEIADVVMWDENEIFMLHVKKGFDSSMRDLSNQISNAARIVENEKNGNKYDFAETMYDELVKRKNKSESEYFNKISPQVDYSNKNDFVELFKNKKISFVLVVKDTGKNRELNHIEKFDSNIAKLSTIDLMRSMNEMDIPLYIEEI